MLHHTSYAVGYIRKGTLKRVPYQGKFGKGVKVYSHNPNSTRYCLVSYYIDTPNINTGGPGQKSLLICITPVKYG
jgi:hypothetical protein